MLDPAHYYASGLDARLVSYCPGALNYHCSCSCRHHLSEFHVSSILFPLGPHSSFLGTERRLRICMSSQQRPPKPFCNDYMDNWCRTVRDKRGRLGRRPTGLKVMQKG